ncbi:hypothetical protein N0B51_10475 [Tsuneonella sp. YG55]|uniref:Uncharacterized protein n=1 Tax=Tsuneonella litorea TaxID=2976475 RepID=A0A9X2W1T0_9SPHN|nr:hypothetical protein [Tsuneonella litorea]MCT2559403.1 hypothetical protein [Tsuneonella litorea]
MAAPHTYTVDLLGQDPHHRERLRLAIAYWSVGPAGRRWLTQAQATIDSTTCAVSVTALH